MKIAVIADVHSNSHSLRAVLEDAAVEKPDIVVGAGDMVGCSAYPGAVDVWNTLHSRGILFVLGNEEQRILRFHEPRADPYLRNSVQFMPLQYRARQFSDSEIDAMRSLPANVLLPGPHGRDVFVCHASPNDMVKSPAQGIDDQMAAELRATEADVVVVGHLHKPWYQHWNGKLLIMAGSGGLPLRGSVGEVDYLLLTYQHEQWQFTYKTVEYDHEAAVRHILRSDVIAQSGPIGWLMLDEALTQEDRLTPFLGDCCRDGRPDELAGWERLVIGYLEQVGRWDAVRPYVRRHL